MMVSKYDDVTGFPGTQLELAIVIIVPKLFQKLNFKSDIPGVRPGKASLDFL